MSSHDTLNTQESRLPSESNKPRLAENHDSCRDDSSSQSTGDAVVTDRRYERGLEVYASQFQIPREEVASSPNALARKRSSRQPVRGSITN
jgi:hypothetical protein